MISLKKHLYLIGFWLLFLVAQTGHCQYVKIQGVVQDSLSGEALPFVNVVFKGKNIGTTTDVNGEFTLETQWGSSSLIVSSVGYVVKEVPISKEPYQTVKVVLAPKVEVLQAVEITVKKKRYRNKDNPAVSLIKNVLTHADENRGRTFEFYEYKKYVKSEYDLNNFTEEWLNSKGMEGFQVLRDYIDTSELNGKPYVPILIQEKTSKVYQGNYGKDIKEVVSGSKLSGFQNGNITSGVDQFMSKIGGEVDIYQHKILLFDKSFTSPISPIGPTIYRYYITDSMKVEGKEFKKIAFMPRNNTMIAFTGYMWVGDSTLNYGVSQIELNLDKRMNINFLDDMRITQEFEYSDTVGWHLVKEKMIVDFQPLNKTIGVFNAKTTLYSDFVPNKPMDPEFYNGLTDVVYANFDTLTDEFWKENRLEELSEDEEGIYDLADSISNIKQFKTFNTVLYLLASGNLEIKKIEYGPVTSLMSYNTVEGIRTRFGMRTNKKFSENWRLSGWGAYGFTDTRFKFMGKAEYYFSTTPYRRLEVSYLEDIYQPGFQVNDIPQDHFLLSFRRTPTTNMFYKKQLNLTYDHEWFPGLMNSVKLNIQSLEATRFNPFINVVTDEVSSFIENNTITLSTRFSHNEKYIQGEFNRYPIKTTAPIFTLDYTFSSTAFGSDFTYHKVMLRIEKRFMPGILGFTDVEIEGNKLFGVVPYPLLVIHPGNESISYDKRSFNMMNFTEFASDQSASLMIEHHFNGLLFSFIPLVRRSKMRVVISGKFLVGSVSNENKDVTNTSLIQRPSRLGELNGPPYTEVGAGIENIFNLFRIDLVKRITYLEADNIGNFMGVKGLAPRIAFKIKF